jgi:hypothetical protein
MLDHPFGKNKNYWLFISQGKASIGKKLTRDGLLKHFQEYYGDKYYPQLILYNKIPEGDKDFIEFIDKALESRYFQTFHINRKI